MGFAFQSPLTSSAGVRDGVTLNHRPMLEPRRIRHPFPLVNPHETTTSNFHKLPAFSALDSSLSSHAHASAASIAVTSAVSSASMVGFFKLFLAFLAGGVFFSTAIAAVGTCYAVGMNNVYRILDISKLVIGHVWQIFKLGMVASKAALLGASSLTEEETEKKKQKWNWKDAWLVLKEKLGETRRAAAEGVEAIRLEAKLYAAAVGTPGLVPLQYILDHLMPLSLAATLEQSLKETLADVKNRNVKSLTLKSFLVGTSTPQLKAARAYDLGEDAMAFDIDTSWDSELEAKINVGTAATGGSVRVPVVVKNVQFDGVVRVVLAPLIREAPGYGAALVSFPVAPKIGLDVRVAGTQVTRVPWLKQELMAAIQKGIADELLWPRRIVIPTPSLPSSKRSLLPKRTLEELASTDPLLRAERALEAKPVIQEAIKRPKPPDKSTVRDMLDIVVDGEASNSTKAIPSESENRTVGTSTDTGKSKKVESMSSTEQAPIKDNLWWQPFRR